MPKSKNDSYTHINNHMQMNGMSYTLIMICYL